MQEKLPEIYNLALPNFLTVLHTICQIKSLFLHFFSFKKLHCPPWLSKLTIVIQTMAFQVKLLSHYVFQSHTAWLWNFTKCCSDSVLYNLFWDEYCFNYKLLEFLLVVIPFRGSYKFMFSLKTVTFYCKRTFQLTV